MKHLISLNPWTRALMEIVSSVIWKSSSEAILWSSLRLYPEDEWQCDTCPFCVSVRMFCTSALRSSSPPVKLYKHRVEGIDGSGASYGELPADIAMSYKPIAPAPSGSNHTPPGNSTLPECSCNSRPVASPVCYGYVDQYTYRKHVPWLQKNNYFWLAGRFLFQNSIGHQLITIKSRCSW